MRCGVRIFVLCCASIWSAVYCGASLGVEMPGQSTIVYKSDTPDIVSMVPRLVGGLFLVAGLAWLATYALRRKMGENSVSCRRTFITIVESKKVTQRTLLVLAKVGPRHVLLAENGEYISMLSLDGPVVVKDVDASAARDDAGVQ